MSEEKAPEATPVPAPEAVAKSKKQKLLMYGLIGGGVLLIIISVVVGFLLSRGHDTPAKHEGKSAEEGHATEEGGHAAEGEHKKEEGKQDGHQTDEHAANTHGAEPAGHGETKNAEHGAAAAESGHGGNDEAALKAEAEKLKHEVGQLQLDVQKQSEMLTLSDEASKLKAEIEELKAKKSALEGDKVKISEGVKQIRSGEKKCVMSGDPAKRMDELRACLGLSGAASGGKETAKAGGHEGPHWSYSGETGPEYWAKLNPEWKLCSAGKTQSPINLVGSYPKGAPSLSFGYKSGAMSIVNNGHTIQVNLKEAGGVELAGKKYSLLQFHFHTPSEEQINGRPSDMVMHMVHKSDDGKLLVIGVLLNKGKDNAALKAVFDNIPREEGGEKSLDAKFDATKMLPTNKAFYHFEGSLTTPPCSEGVQWFVLKEQGNLSPKQFGSFSGVYPYNARPIQQVNGRKIVE
ncbi:carbonic anhydrase family protein [Leeia sp. TBRC 13508]|uniref:carbonic anhydrase n=1 Tax=Leeia speluncae TaxID=2884804 RepID=A0ABS8D3F4_9NEIS|nr:carbonic anhydrase family protein [Leeia speluncae]MCB6182531.1 carbonic anhydrase family protein [Leeia speluncae]